MNKGLDSGAKNESWDDGIQAPSRRDGKKNPWVLEVGGKATKLSETRRNPLLGQQQRRRGICIPRSKIKITKAGSSSLSEQYKRQVKRNVNELVRHLENEEMMRIAQQENHTQNFVRRTYEGNASFVKRFGDKVRTKTITSISEKADAADPSSILRSPNAAKIAKSSTRDRFQELPVPSEILVPDTRVT